MRRYGRASGTRRYPALTAAVIAVSVALALLDATPVSLLIAAYFLVYSAVSYSYLRCASRGIACRAERVELEPREADAVLRAQLAITPGARFASPRLYIEMPPQLSRVGVRAATVLKLEPGAGRARVETRLPRRTGLHVIGPLILALADPLGIFEVPVCELSPVVVKIPPKAGLAPLARWYGIVRSSSGARTLSPGLGVEYHSTREYRPEDELRHIDWKATARLGKLHVKVFEMETPLRVLLALDAQSHMFIGSPRSLFEYCADLVAALASYLLKRGDRLVLSVITEDGVRHTSEVRGHRGLVEVLDVLSSVEWPARPPVLRAKTPPWSGSLRALGESLADFSAVVLFSPVLDERRALEISDLARRARESGVEFIVVAPLVTFFSTASRVDDAVYKVLRFNMVSREIKNVRLLEGSGVRVIRLSPHRALERVVADLERTRITKAR